MQARDDIPYERNVAQQVTGLRIMRLLRIR
jgi:hypothetical protein